jgi:hypothetical protein
MATATTIEFKRRAVCELRNECRRKIWESHCGRYRVIYSKPLVGKLPATWYAMAEQLSSGVVNSHRSWTIISKHRKRDPAFEACQKHAREVSQ